MPRARQQRSAEAEAQACSQMTLGGKNRSPPSLEEEVIGKGGRKRQQMGEGVEQQKYN